MTTGESYWSGLWSVTYHVAQSPLIWVLLVIGLVGFAARMASGGHR